MDGIEKIDGIGNKDLENISKSYRGLLLGLIAEELPIIGSLFDKFEPGKRIENLERIRRIIK